MPEFTGIPVTKEQKEKFELYRIELQSELGENITRGDTVEMLVENSDPAKIAANDEE